MERIVDIDSCMLKENIIDFLKTGELAHFPFGISSTSVFSMLGEAKWTIPISRKDKRIAVAKYGQIEFYFDHELSQKLYGVQLTYTQKGEKGKMEMDCQGFEDELSYNETKKLLFKHGVVFKEKANKVDDSKVITTKGGVVFYFKGEDTLQKIGKFVQ